jgi:hypothetical protein
MRTTRRSGCGGRYGRCAYCNTYGRLTREHVIPKSRRRVKGGIVLACRACNSSKSNLFVSEWFEALYNRNYTACRDITSTAFHNMGRRKKANRSNRGRPRTSKKSSALTRELLDRDIDAYMQSANKSLTQSSAVDRTPSSNPCISGQVANIVQSFQ